MQEYIKNRNAECPLPPRPEVLTKDNQLPP